MIAGDARAAYLGRVGLRVRACRIGRALSQDQLAAVAGMSRVTLGSVERGDHDAGLVTYLSLAIALKVPLSVLVEDDDGMAEILSAIKRRHLGLAPGPEQSEGLPS